MIGMIELATSDDGSFWTVVREFGVEMVGGLSSASWARRRSCR